MRAAGKSRSNDMSTMEALTVAGAYPGADPLDHGRKVVAPRNACQPSATRFDAKEEHVGGLPKSKQMQQYTGGLPKRQREAQKIRLAKKPAFGNKDAKRTSPKDCAPRSAYDAGPKTQNGLHIEYSPANQGFFLMWYGQVLRVFNSKAEAKLEMDDLLRKRPQQGTNQTMVGPDSSPFDQASTPAELAAPTQDQITEKFFDAFGVQPNFGVNGRR
jgi:hypothetical protein